MARRIHNVYKNRFLSLGTSGERPGAPNPCKTTVFIKKSIDFGARDIRGAAGSAKSFRGGGGGGSVPGASGGGSTKKTV